MGQSIKVDLFFPRNGSEKKLSFHSHFQKIKFSFLFSAVSFLHSNFSKFILHTTSESDFDSRGRRNMLTELLLALLRVNGTPLMDVSIDLSPRNSSRFIGVVRAPQRSGLIPGLLRSRRGVAILNKWVRKSQLLSAAL